MKSYFLCTSTGPKLVLTSCDLISYPECLNVLKNQGIAKFIAFEVPVEHVKQRYGEQFNIVMNNPDEHDELRVLDADGRKVLAKINLSELGHAISFEEAVPDSIIH